MFSKWTVAAVLLLAGLSSACSRENEPDTQPIRVEVQGSSCLSDIAEKLGEYTHDKLSDAETAKIWDCAAQAVSDFQRISAGDLPQGHFSAETMRHFLQRFFLKDYPVSDELLAAVMELKRVLVGGSTTEITRPELERFKVFLSEMKAITVELNPVAGIIFNTRAGATDAETQAAGDLLVAGTQRFSRWLRDSHQSYSYDSMIALVRALAGFYGESPDDGNYADVIKAVRLFPRLKRILLASSGEGIASSEWTPTLTAMAEGYAGFLHFRFGFKGDLNRGLVRRSVPYFMERAMLVLERAALKHPEHKIPAADWQALFDQLESNGWLGEGIKSEALMGAWSWFAGRVLAKGQQPAADLGLKQIAHLRAKASEWHELLFLAEGKQVKRTPEVGRFLRVRDASAPQEWDSEGRMLFAAEAPSTWTPAAQRRLVWPFMVLNLLREAYAGPQPDSLTMEQVEHAVNEVLPILQSFGWMLSTQPTIGARLQREADLFTLSGNGDGNLDLHEAVRYVAFIGSSLRIAEIWLQKGEAECGQDAPSNCLRAAGFTDPDVLSFAPQLQERMQAAGFPAFRKYMLQAEETVLEEVPELGYGKGDLLMVLMMFQYVETFLRRFDVNANQTIQLPEGLEAYKIYGRILGELLSGAGLPEDEVLAFFTFLMKYGDTPFTMFGGQVLYQHWKWHQNDWAFDADRTGLMSILNQLSKL